MKRIATRKHCTIRLFANDVIITGSVRADWPAPFNVTIGNPRADKLGRNGFECIGRRDRERCVRATFKHIAPSIITACFTYNDGWRVQE